MSNVVVVHKYSSHTIKDQGISRKDAKRAKESLKENALGFVILFATSATLREKRI
jgi:hypothetical protein